MYVGSARYHDFVSDEQISEFSTLIFEACFISF